MQNCNPISLGMLEDVTKKLGLQKVYTNHEPYSEQPKELNLLLLCDADDEFLFELRKNYLVSITRASSTLGLNSKEFDAAILISQDGGFSESFYKDLHRVMKWKSRILEITESSDIVWNNN